MNLFKDLICDLDFIVDCVKFGVVLVDLCIIMKDVKEICSGVVVLL